VRHSIIVSKKDRVMQGAGFTEVDLSSSIARVYVGIKKSTHPV
jgi:hypothetical protein